MGTWKLKARGIRWRTSVFYKNASLSSHFCTTKRYMVNFENSRFF